MNQTPNYIQHFTPDWTRILKIIMSFKGNRTMAQYAEDCESISASTLSRIATGKVTRPLTYEMMVMLFNHRDKNSEFDLADLIRANGMIDPETQSRFSSQSNNYSIREMRNREIAMQNILTNELLKRGIAIKIQAQQMTRREQMEKESSGSIILRPDLTITLPEGKNINTWYFEFTAAMPEKDDYLHNFKNLARRSFEGASTYLISDAWAPEKYKDTKTSFVFLDEDIYNTFRIYFRGNRLNSPMSTILIDLEAGKVVREETLNLEQSPASTSLFDLPLISNENDEYSETEDELDYIETLRDTFIPKND